MAVWSTCSLSDPLRGGAACHVASILSGALWWSVASAFALYAAWRRAALRRRFGISARGGACADVTAWLCCPACALCQETRTLSHNNVTAGFWLGPKPGAAAAADLQAGLPGVYSPPAPALGQQLSYEQYTPYYSAPGNLTPPAATPSSVQKPQVRVLRTCFCTCAHG